MADNTSKITLEQKALQNLKNIEEQLAAAREKNNKKQIKDLEEQLDKINKFIEKSKGIKEVSDSFKDTADSISFLSRSTDAMTKSLNLAGKQVKALTSFAFSGNSEVANEIAKAARDVIDAQKSVLSIDLNDEAAKKEAEDYLDLAKSEFADLGKKVRETGDEYLKSLFEGIASNISKANKELEATQGLTEDEIEQYKQLTSEADAMNKRIKAFGTTISVYMQRPMVAVGAAVALIGKGITKLGENIRQFGGTMDSAVYSTTLLGFVFKDANGVAQGLSEEFGSMKDVSFGTQLNANLMAVNLGISGGEAAKLVGHFSRLNNNSKDTAFNMIASAEAMADAAGVNTSAMMKDIASNSGKFAEYSNDGGKNLIEAGLAAQKLGVTLSTISNVADSLLDFETSITKELELGAYLGRNINLNSARDLAYRGKTGAALKETIKQLGGIQAFNNMDYYAKKQTAALLGVSVDELVRMSANYDKLNEDGSYQQSTWDKTSQIITALTTGPLGSLISGVGVLLMTGIQFAFQWGMINRAIDRAIGKITTLNTVQSTGNITGNIPTPGPTQTPRGGGGGLGKSIGSFGRGIGSSMKGIAVGFKAFSDPRVLLGLGAITLAIMGIGYALNLAAPGIKAFGEAVSSIVRSVGDAVKNVIGGLGDFFMKVASVATPELALSVLGLAAGFAALTSSLAAFSLVGLAAIPAMAAVSAFGSSINVGAIATTGGEVWDDKHPIIMKMEQLKEAFNATRDVYLDKTKVTALVVNTSDRSTKNQVKINNN